MQQNLDPLISIAAAAEKLGLNRSTIARQVAKGQICSHAGKVRLSEVIENRAKNLYPRRGGAHRRRDSESVASASHATAEVTAEIACTEIFGASRIGIARTHLDAKLPAATAIEVGALDALSMLLRRIKPALAGAALGAGCSIPQAYVVVEIAKTLLLESAEDVCTELGLPGWAAGDVWFALAGDDVREPDWPALAASAGERFARAECEEVACNTPFFSDWESGSA